jgi:hypothetical protein
VFDATAPPRHKRAPRPVHFPAEAERLETKRHLKLRTLLFAVLETFADRAAVGSEQFVYYAANTGVEESRSRLGEEPSPQCLPLSTAARSLV